MSDAATNTDKKLLAGKYETVEALEEGYKNVNSSASRVVNEKAELEKKLNDLTKVPDDYVVEADLAGLPANEVAEIKDLAKKAGLNQTAFNKLAKETATKLTSIQQVRQQQQEIMRKELGEDKIAIVKEFVEKNYPGKAAKVVLNNALADKELFNDLMNQRNSSLDSSAPGFKGMAPPPGHVSNTDILKAREAMLANPADLSKRDAYLNLLSIKAKNN